MNLQISLTVLQETDWVLIRIPLINLAKIDIFIKLNLIILLPLLMPLGNSSHTLMYKAI